MSPFLNDVAFRATDDDRLRALLRLGGLRLAGTRLGGAFLAGLLFGGAALAARALDTEVSDLVDGACGPLGATGSVAAGEADWSGGGAESWGGRVASVSGIDHPVYRACGGNAT